MSTEPPQPTQENMTLAEKDRERVEALFRTAHHALEQVGEISAKRLGHNVSGQNPVKMVFTFDAGEGGAILEKEKGRSKYCSTFPDGTCGCYEVPPGICRPCGPGDLD
jgi:hypothetical protein